MRTERFIHRTSIVITIVMFILAYGTLGSLEQGNINMLQATHYTQASNTYTAYTV